MRLGFLFAVPILPWLVSSAAAESIPRYEVPAYCQQVADVSGGSSMIYNGCIDMEQEAYNALKTSWSSVPSRMRRYCDDVGKVSGGSYSILKGCVEMETDAAGSTPEFKY
jgi:hypothetical protein